MGLFGKKKSAQPPPKPRGTPVDDLFEGAPGPAAPATSVPVQRVKTGTHGSHWAAVIDDTERLLPLIEETMGGGNPMRSARAPCLDRGEVRVVAARKRLAGRVWALVAGAELETGSLEVGTGYPFLESNCRTKLEAERFEEWPIQIEGWLHGRLGEARASFFPADFFHRRVKYLTGRVKEVSLAGFAYALRLDPFKGSTFKGPQGKPVTMDQAELFLPLSLTTSGVCPDDWYVSGHVTAVERLKPMGMDACIVRMTCVPIGEIEVFCLEKNVTGVPEAGCVMGGELWLQGRDPTAEFEAKEKGGEG